MSLAEFNFANIDPSSSARHDWKNQVGTQNIHQKIYQFLRLVFLLLKSKNLKVEFWKFWKIRRILSQYHRLNTFISCNFFLFFKYLIYNVLKQKLFFRFRNFIVPRGLLQKQILKERKKKEKDDKEKRRKRREEPKRKKKRKRGNRPKPKLRNEEKKERKKKTDPGGVNTQTSKNGINNWNV